MKQRTKKLLIIIFILVIAIIAGLCIMNQNGLVGVNPQIISDDDAVDWNGNQKLDGYKNGNGSDRISIPCFDGLVFKTNQTTQKVNIHNPETNTCYMVISLIVEDETIWKSEMIAPNKGFYEIELNHPLDSGTYNAYLLVECYDMVNGNPMNNGLSEFTLYVQ